MKPTSYISDWTNDVKTRFQTAFMYVLVFVILVLAGAEVRNGFSVPFSELLIALLIGLIVCSVIAVWIAFTGLTEIRFDDNSVHFVRRFFHYYKTTTIPYAQCRVAETFYWKFINHFFLKFHNQDKLVIVIGKDEWTHAYLDIKNDILRRLAPDQYEFQNDDSSITARRLTSRST